METQKIDTHGLKFDALGIHDFEKSFTLKPDNNVWIFGHTLCLLKKEDSSKLATLRSRATGEILRNNLRCICRIGLYQRTIKHEKITFSDIFNLATMLDKEKHKPFEHIIYSFTDILERGISQILVEHASDELFDGVNIDDEHQLYFYSLKPEFQAHILPLTKRITCQCLELDDTATTEMLNERYDQFLLKIFTSSDSSEQRKRKAHCCSILYTLNKIWSVCNWENVTAVTIEPESRAQKELKNYLEEQKREVQNILLSYAKARLVTGQAQEILRLMSEDTSKDQTEDKATLTVSSTEVAHSQVLEVTESFSDKSSSTEPEKITSPKSQTAAFVPAPQSETIERSLSSQTPDVRPKRKPLPEPRSRKPLTIKEPEKMPGATALTTEAVEHFMPEQRQSIVPFPWLDTPEAISPIRNLQEFHHHVAQCADRLHAMYAHKENIVRAYIHDPKNASAFDHAKQVIFEGSWISTNLYGLLTEATKKTPGHNNVFRSRLNSLIAINAFYLGYAPQSSDFKTAFMTNESARISGGFIEFRLQSGIQPSTALESFFTNFNIIDSSSATLLALYQAMLDYLTAPIFDRLFKNTIKPTMDVTPNFFVGSLSRMYDCKALITDYLFTENKPIPPKKGYILYASNHSDFYARHSSKQEVSMLLVCISDREKARYTAPGRFSGYNQKEVNTEVVNLYNREPITNLMMSQADWARVKRQLTLKTNYAPISRLSIEALRQDKGGLQLGSPAYIHFDKLAYFKSKNVAMLQHTSKAKEVVTPSAMPPPRGSQIIEKPTASRQGIQQLQESVPKTPEESQARVYRELPGEASSTSSDSTQALSIAQPIEPDTSTDARVETEHPSTPPTPLAEADSTVFETMTREGFTDYILKCVEDRRLLCQQQDRITQAYFDKPDDHEIQRKVLEIINQGSWNPEKLYDFLIQAVKTPRKEIFEKRLETLVNSGSLLSGHPPQNRATKRHFMTNTFGDIVHDNYFDYTITPYTTASEALLSFKQEFNFINSYQALMLALYQATHDYLTPRAFNVLYTQGLDPKSTFRLVSPNKRKENPLNFFLKESTSQTIKKGDVVMFRNHLNYQRRHRSDRDMYIIAICTSGRKPPTFTSPDLFENLTEHEINILLVQQYNREPKKMKMLPKEARATFNPPSPTPEAGNMTVEALLQNQGGLQKDSVHHIDFDMLKTLKKKDASIKKAYSTTAVKKKALAIKTGAKKEKHYSQKTKTEIEKQTEQLRSNVSREPEVHQSAETLLSLIRKKRNLLKSLCTGSVTPSESTITKTVTDINTLTQQLNEKSEKIPDTFNKQLEEILQAAEKTRKIAQLTDMQIKLRSLCEKTKSHQTTEVTQLANNIRKIMQTMKATDADIPTHLKNKIDEDFSRIEESKASSSEEDVTISSLKEKQRELQALCGEKSPKISNIRTTVSTIRELMRRLNDMNIDIPKELASQISADFRTAVYIQNSTALVEMHRTLHDLWKDAKRNPERIAEIPAAIDTIRTLIVRLEGQGAKIPEVVRGSIEKDIRTAEKLLNR